jgi:hypothetical protein
VGRGAGEALPTATEQGATRSRSAEGARARAAGACGAASLRLQEPWRRRRAAGSPATSWVQMPLLHRPSLNYPATLIGVRWARIRPAIFAEERQAWVQRRGSRTRSGRVEGARSGPRPAAGRSAGNPSRVNRDTWVPAREAASPAARDGYFRPRQRFRWGAGTRP